MIQVRKFGPEIKTPIPPPVKGVSAAMIQLQGNIARQLGPAEVNKRFNGMPFIVDSPTTVLMMYFDENGEIHEHSAPDPILFLVIDGTGFVRIGGETGETVQVGSGEAVLWPANELHRVWTEGEKMQALVIHLPESAGQPLLLDTSSASEKGQA
jgi:quercetin dioxygenase-like cupin family protein